MIVDRSKCMSCGACAGVCREGAITLNGTVVEFDDALCTKCGLCINACPVGALEE